MQATLGVPRLATWETLQKTRNIAAVATLAQGLGSSNAQLRTKCVQAILKRDEQIGYRTLLLHWEKLADEEVEIVRKEAVKFVPAAQELLARGSLSEKRSVLQAILALDMTAAVDAVIEIVINPRHALCAAATGCLLALCRRWGQLSRSGNDMPSVRMPLLDRLYYKLSLFHEHKNETLVDAWLFVVHWNDAQHRSLLSDPRQDVYRPLLARLAESREQPILQLLGGYVGRSGTPKQVLDLLVDREEPELAIEIARLADGSLLPSILRRLRQLPTLKSLQAIVLENNELNFDLQKRLWIMLAASSEDMRRVLRGAIRLSTIGSADARQTAADMLVRCRRRPLEELVPAMQEASLSGDAGNLFDSMQEIAGWLQSPSIVLKKAAEDFFQEFTLGNLLEKVKTWPMQMSKTMACIVRLADRNVGGALCRELQCPSPKRRLSALQVTEMLECADQVSEQLIPLMEDSRLDVRVRTIDVLSALGHESLEQMIPQLMTDASTDVQDAANRAARRFQRRKAMSSNDIAVDI